MGLYDLMSVHLLKVDRASTYFCLPQPSPQPQDSGPGVSVLFSKQDKCRQEYSWILRTRRLGAKQGFELLTCHISEDVLYDVCSFF